MRKTVVFWIVILIAALWVNSTWAKSTVPSWSGEAWLMPEANVPTFTDGSWVMPARPIRTAPMAQDSGFSGYEAEIAEACAHWGCDPGYVASVMYCESGGDHGALAYNPSSGNYTYGIFQIDGMWGGGGMSATEQIWFAAEHLTKGDIWWACG